MKHPAMLTPEERTETLANASPEGFNWSDLSKTEQRQHEILLKAQFKKVVSWLKEHNIGIEGFGLQLTRADTKALLEAAGMAFRQTRPTSAQRGRNESRREVSGL